MKRLLSLLLLFFLLGVGSVWAQTITPARALDATALTKVTLSTEINTTLLFPSAVAGCSFWKLPGTR